MAAVTNSVDQTVFNDIECFNRFSALYITDDVVSCELDTITKTVINSPLIQSQGINVQASVTCTNSECTGKETLRDNCIFEQVKEFYVKNRSHFKMAHININSIRNKFHPFKEIMTENVFDMLSIQETKIDSSFPDAQFQIPYYKLYRNDLKCDEGGLMMYLRSDMPQNRRTDVEKMSINDRQGRIEILAVEASIKNEKWIFISIYKQPKVKIACLIECLDKVVHAILDESVNIIILGDLNVNMFKENKLTECLDINGLKNIIKDATCKKGKPTLIDLIISNKPRRLASTLSVDTGLSDFHNLICTATKFDVPKQRATKIMYRSYRKFNNDNFLKDLSIIPYHVCEIFEDIDDSYWLYNELTMEVVNEHAPIKQKTIKGYRVPYMNGELRRAINVKNMLNRKYKKCKGKTSWENYKSQRNKVTKLRKKSLNMYLKTKCNESKGGQDFWQTIKPLISHKCINKDDSILLCHNDSVVSKPEQVGELFNEYFINITNNIGKDDSIKELENTMTSIYQHKDHTSIKTIMQSMSENPNVPQEFYFRQTDSNVIRKLLMDLKIKKATGHDMLPAKLLKLGSESLCLPIAQLINKCISSGKFPSSMKYADVCPIFKKGNNMDIANYRPVSILPSMSKIFEKVIIEPLSTYFENILTPYVSGFRRQHSCETVLVRMVENVKKALDEGKVVCAVLIDLSKAFDCLPHKLLVSKFKAYGVSLSACNVITSYLRDRKQRVRIGSSKTDWLTMKKGSPQGSIFGPFTYNVFTNDVFMLMDDDVDVYNYADDNTLVCSGYNYEDVKSKVLDYVRKMILWFEENNMKVNPDKFQCIVFGKADNIGTFEINGNQIEAESSVKLLGMCIDNKLNFNDHVTEISRKAGRQVQVLARLSRVLNYENKMLLYNSFIECYFNYCSVIWHSTSNESTLKIEKIQEKALRFITLDFSSSYHDLLNVCNKSPLYVIRLRKILELVFKILNKKTPMYLSIFAKRKISVRTLRRCNDLHLPKFKTILYGKKTMTYLAAMLWNSLDNDIQNAITLTNFKTQINKWSGPKCKCGFCIQCIISNR